MAKQGCEALAAIHVQTAAVGFDAPVIEESELIEALRDGQLIAPQVQARQLIERGERRVEGAAQLAIPQVDATHAPALWVRTHAVPFPDGRVGAPASRAGFWATIPKVVRNSVLPRQSDGNQAVTDWEASLGLAGARLVPSISPCGMDLVRHVYHLLGRGRTPNLLRRLMRRHKAHNLEDLPRECPALGHGVEQRRQRNGVGR